MISKTGYLFLAAGVVVLLISGFCVRFTPQIVWAGASVEDIFNIETKEIEKRKKASPKFELVKFTHKKHHIDYNISCGVCHHDQNNKPLTLKMGDDVSRCVDCHSKLKKNKKNKKDILVLENAMHGKCITCHKDTNKKAGDKKGLKGPAPATCGKCHIAIKKK